MRIQLTIARIGTIGAAFYINFGSGDQTWSLENICMNLTSDSNQVKIYKGYGANVTYAKKVNVTTNCGLPRPDRPDYLMPLLVAFVGLIMATLITLYCLKRHKKCWWKKKRSQTY